jgi:hypothetical protein
MDILCCTKKIERVTSPTEKKLKVEDRGVKFAKDICRVKRSS